MTAERATAGPGTAPAPPWRTHALVITAVTLFAAHVVMGDLVWRSGSPVLAVAWAAAAGIVVLIYILSVGTNDDWLDATCAVLLALTCVSSVFSHFPRQSLGLVFAAFAYVAAFYIGRRFLRRLGARRLLVVGLRGLSLLLTVVAAFSFISPFLNWWGLVEWRVAPPLDLRVGVGPWGYRHDAVVLLLCLYPSWWASRPARGTAGIGVLVGLATLAIMAIDGSRTIWFAAACGCIAVVVPRLGRVARGRRNALIVLSLSVIVTASIVAIALGLGPISERLGRLAPLAERGALWGALVEAWADSPLVGIGPGSFPWPLSLTDYYEGASFAARHPDSALAQLLVEGGLGGVIVGATFAAVALKLVLRRGHSAARFAVVAVLAASLTLNPLAVPPIASVALAWIALSAPSASPSLNLATRGRLWRPVIGVGVCAVYVAWALTVTAGALYAVGRNAAQSGDLEGAAASLGLASTLDPSHAAYSRAAGTALLLRGDLTRADELLRGATALNPHDDQAWRILGLTRLALGDQSGADHAVMAAIRAQRSDFTNLLLAAALLTDHGQLDRANELLAEVVQAWPSVVAAPEWSGLVDNERGMDIVALALSRWEAGAKSAVPAQYQELLLSIMLGDAGNTSESASEESSLRNTYRAVMSCSADAWELLETAPDGDWRQSTYWELRIRQAALTGRDSETYRELHRIMTNDSLYSRLIPAVNPVDENAARSSSADAWGYDILSIEWPVNPMPLPSPYAGLNRWHLSPREAARDAGLAASLQPCFDASNGAYTLASSLLAMRGLAGPTQPGVR